MLLPITFHGQTDFETSIFGFNDFIGFARLEARVCAKKIPCGLPQGI